MAEIQNISIELVKVHPNNVRKTYNDIEELAESIKAKGILQNLTVVPDPQEPGKYLTVIGNRRLTAARMAGLETVPCIVSDMDEKEQTSVMLLENIQRSDLTVYEQAQGFQMMLDLGETEDTIAEKTGFSKKTVRHRLRSVKPVAFAATRICRSIHSSTIRRHTEEYQNARVIPGRRRQSR